MYLRTTQRKNRDGSIVRYIQLAHNRRVDGVTQAEVKLLNLGREDRLDADGLRRLVRSINRYLGEPDAGGDDGIEPGDGLSVVSSRPIGVAWLLDGLWRQLGVDRALATVLGGRKFTTDVERVLFALVANRAIDSASKLAAAEWASNDVAIAGLEAMDDDQAYRAMDLLVAADAQAQVQEAVFFAVADLLNLEVDLLFFDTTSTYFETETADEFRRHGKSKDSRPDLQSTTWNVHLVGSRPPDKSSAREFERGPNQRMRPYASAPRVLWPRTAARGALNSCTRGGSRGGGWGGGGFTVGPWIWLMDPTSSDCSPLTKRCAKGSPRSRRVRIGGTC
ncbi:MAG: hypothetical protein CL424_02430 [Acidimicrobiaceae bacterium]|nr:hypothetical protein [Acidimicrobiaceae bacterium]